MTASLLLARLIGPLFLVVGLGMLVNRAYYRTMITSFLKDPGLYYFSGTLALVVGLAMVLFHNLWTADWRVVITAIGWLSVLKGAVRILLPTAGTGLALRLSEANWPVVSGGLLLLGLGGWLTFRGFGLLG